MVTSGMDDSSFSVRCVYDTRLGFLSRFSTFTQLSATSVLLLRMSADIRGRPLPEKCNQDYAGRRQMTNVIMDLSSIR